MNNFAVANIYVVSTDIKKKKKKLLIFICVLLQCVRSVRINVEKKRKKKNRFLCNCVGSGKYSPSTKTKIFLTKIHNFLFCFFHGVRLGFYRFVFYSQTRQSTRMVVSRYSKQVHVLKVFNVVVQSYGLANDRL